MPILLIILFVLLALLLTIGFFPLLIGAGWILLVVIGLVIVILCFKGIFAALGGLILGVFGAFSPQPNPAKDTPKYGDPDYLDWANRRGKYAPRSRSSKSNPPPANGLSGQLPHPVSGDDDYLDWANREGAYKDIYAPTKIVRLMQDEGYPRFAIHHHTGLWRELNAKDPAKGYGRGGQYGGNWGWFDNWVDRVRAHCQENADRYQ